MKKIKITKINIYNKNLIVITIILSCLFVSLWVSQSNDKTFI